VLLKKLGKYEIVEWLGGGRFGDVFLARDTIIEKEFALKISRMRRNEINMLKSEARLLAALNHPNIVRFFNIDFIESKFVMVMEYVKGNDLRDLITEGGIPVAETIRIITQVVDALSYAHANQVLHRDLKPENILITETGKGPAVKITDFGLARFIRSGSISASSAGTPIYMAPETWAGNANEASDIWSLGVILYELLTGRPPFLDDSLEGLKQKIERGKLIAPATLRRDIPEQIEDMVLSALGRDPRSRPTARELHKKITQTDESLRAVGTVNIPPKKSETIELTPAQREIISALDGPVLVTGQAGCGKTTVLTSAAAGLIQQGIPSSSMLVCTFTNKAAADIRDRLCRDTDLSPHDLWLGTFHTLGFRILRRDAERLDISEDFVIEQPRTILERTGLKTGKYRINAVLKMIGRLKARGITPGKFKPQNTWEQKCQEAYEKYQTFKLENSLLDYDDLILLSIELLTGHEDLRQHYQDLFAYIFVDELQDINPAQYALINLIYKERIFFTGDEDQSIYGWRGAEPEIIYRVPKDYPEVRMFHLNTSFRLAPGILDIANNLMKREAVIIPASHSADVFVHAARSEKDEANYVIREIRDLHKQGLTYKDIVVLCRMNLLAHVYEEALARARIPHALISGSLFHERADIKPVVDYLLLLQEMPRGTGDADTFIARANALLKPKKKDYERAAAIFEHHRGNPNLIEISKLIEDIADLTSNKSQNIAELLSMARVHEGRDLTGFLNELRLIQELDLVDWKTDVVKIMTVHSAKGLQFPAVFIVDLVEDIFPLTKKMSSQKEIEEERRLCYVALTRAQKKLYLLYPKWRHGRYQHPSRFLVDMLKGEP